MLASAGNEVPYHPPAHTNDNHVGENFTTSISLKAFHSGASQLLYPLKTARKREMFSKIVSMIADGVAWFFKRISSCTPIADASGFSALVRMA